MTLCIIVNNIITYIPRSLSLNLIEENQYMGNGHLASFLFLLQQDLQLDLVIFGNFLG